jgi:N-acetylglucosaminyl-diphospho-decaprenol L-rhamnosyltransferase
MTPEAPPGQAAAVIVSYNVRHYLIECVRSLRADGLQQIVVVDNASSDGSVDAVRAADPDVIVLALDRNVGFAGGVNRGVALTATPYAMVLNPDVVVEPGSTKALVEYLEREADAGMVGPRIDTPDGELYPSVRRFPSVLDATGHAFLWFVWAGNPFTRRYRMLDWDHEQACDVDWIAGTHFVVRRPAWDQLGGLDERYFMYGEDVDLCWRMWRAGWRVAYEPAARVTHAIGRSTDQRPYRMILAHHRSLYRFSATSLSGRRRALLPLVAVALGVRTGMAWLQRLLRRRPHAAP